MSQKSSCLSVTVGATVGARAYATHHSTSSAEALTSCVVVTMCHYATEWKQQSAGLLADLTEYDVDGGWGVRGCCGYVFQLTVCNNGSPVSLPPSSLQHNDRLPDPAQA